MIRNLRRRINSTKFILFLDLFLLFSCDSYHQKDDQKPMQIRFSLFETYKEIIGSKAEAYVYISSTEKIQILRESVLTINDTLMSGKLYACNKVKNKESLTGFSVDSIFSYKFYMNKSCFLDYELLDFIKNYSDSIVYLNIDEKEIYRDTFNKTYVTYDAPMLESRLKGCFD